MQRTRTKSFQNRSSLRLETGQTTLGDSSTNCSNQGKRIKLVYRLSPCPLARASWTAKDGFRGGNRCRPTERIFRRKEVGHGSGPNVGGAALWRFERPAPRTRTTA